MKVLLQILFICVFIISIFSCKTSENFTFQTIGKSDALKDYQTFQFIGKSFSSEELEQLDVSFKKKLEQVGFSEDPINPDFLVQTLKVSKEFVQVLGSYITDPSSSGTASSPGIGYSDFVTNSFEAGKLIFLIQDAKSNEVVWMGVGSGIFPKKESEKYQLTAQTIDAILADIR